MPRQDTVRTLRRMVIAAGEVVELQRRLAPYIRHTPLIAATGGGLLKLESLQPTGSFKVRGFFNAALALSSEQRRRGLLTVSAGNAALACAHVARELDVPCRVVMFDTAPAVKADRVRALGAGLLPMSREQLYEWIRTRSWEQEPETFIHPFANAEVIAGHGTIAAEILDDAPDVERVLVPVGGGGLICGVAAAFAALGHPVTVVGVQSNGYPLWPRAFEAGGAVSLVPDTIADGTTAPFDATMFEPLRSLVHEWVVVPEAELRRGVVRVITDAKLVAEGAGALAFTAMSAAKPSERTVAIVSGGNIDPTLLAQLLTAP